MTEAFEILEEAIIRVKWRLVCQSSVITQNFHTQLKNIPSFDPDCAQNEFDKHQFKKLLQNKAISNCVEQN